MDTKWLLIGGGAVVVVLILVMNQNNSSQNSAAVATNSGQQQVGSSPTSNVGTPVLNNGSLSVFTDPTSGMSWLWNPFAADPNSIGGAANPIEMPTTNLQFLQGVSQSTTGA